MSRHRAPEHDATRVPPPGRSPLQLGTTGSDTVLTRRPLPPVPAVTR